MFDWFSIDPTHKKYGDVTRMKADYHWTVERGIYENLERAHTSYYDPDTESLANISRVVVGKPEEVTREEQRTRVIGGGYRNVVGRAFTDSPEKTTTKSRRKRATAEASATPSPDITPKGFPVLRTTSRGRPAVALEKRGHVGGKFSAVYGGGFFTPDFVDVLTKSDRIDIIWGRQPTGFLENQVLIVELNPDGSTCSYGKKFSDKHHEDYSELTLKTLSFGFPEAGKVIVLALVPISSSVPSGRNRIRRSDVDVPDLAKPTADFHPLKRIIGSRLRPLTDGINIKEGQPGLQIPAAAKKQVVDSVRDYFHSHPTRWNEKNSTFRKIRDGGYSDESAWLSIFLTQRGAVKIDSSTASFPNTSGKTQKWTDSGEVYLIDAMPEPDRFKVEARPGPGRFFKLNKMSSLSLPPWCDFRWTPAGGEVKCQPPLSITGDRLPILALFDTVDGRVIDVISMDNEWHTIPLDRERIYSESPYIVIGAIVTSRSEERALPSGTKGRKLDQYPLDILPDEVDQLDVTEKWLKKLELEGVVSAGSFDVRGLARAIDPLLGVLKEIGEIPESSIPVARVLLKSMLKTAESSTPLGVQAKKVMTSSDEYTGSISRMIPFHKDVYQGKYSGGRIPPATEIVADLEGMKPHARMMQHPRYRDAWENANTTFKTAQRNFENEVAALNRELRVGAKNSGMRTDPIVVPKSPSIAFRTGFFILSAINLGVSLSGGIAEGDILAQAVAAGSSIAVAMPFLQQSLSMLGKTKAAGLVGKFAPFVSIFANILSLANNLRQEDIDELAVAFDVMSIAADLLIILALKFSALGPVGTTLGLVVAAASVAYIVTHWGAILPPPDQFVKELGGKLVDHVESSLETSRIDWHQRLEYLGLPDRRIAELWNTSHRSSISKAIVEQFGKEKESSPIISKDTRIAMANSTYVYNEIEYLLDDEGAPLRRPSEGIVRKLYDELTKYCVKKIVDRVEESPPGKQIDLRGLSFSLKEWGATREARPWISDCKKDLKGYF
ncbi:hypothetical protein [Streptomyces formicae]|uniref:hypothetical protein n=1 Tax=Streptomyces formicae TaxID=1616117 RepID=UPI003615C863